MKQKHNNNLQPVIEKEMNALTPDEPKIYVKQIYQAKLQELNNGNNLGCFNSRSRASAHNVVDARWEIRWKGVSTDGTTHDLVDRCSTWMDVPQGPHLRP
eukprot:10801141-Heterocapsa_arctica.AAC.1